MFRQKGLSSLAAAAVLAAAALFFCLTPAARADEPDAPPPPEPVVKLDPVLDELLLSATLQGAMAGSDAGVQGMDHPAVKGDDSKAAFMAANIDPATITPKTLVDVIIFIAPQGGDAIGRRVRAAHREKIDALGAEILEIRRGFFPKGQPLTPAGEELFSRQWHSYVPASDADRLRRLKEEMDAESARIDEEITRELRRAFGPSQDELAGFIERLGGEVTGRLTAVNVIGARIPVGALESLAGHEHVLTVKADGPLALSLDNQFVSTGADTFHDDSPAIDGWPWDIGSVDSGVDETHPALSSHNFIENYAGNGYHGTGTVGCYASTDATYQGLASGLDTIFVEDFGGSEMTSMMGFDWILTYTGEGAEVFNFSVNSTAHATDTDYSEFDRFFDGIATTYDLIISNSAGNYGWGTTTIGHPAPAYNILVSANMDDNDDTVRSSDRIAGTSSTGPTLSGRKKPDITAPGTDTYTTDTGGGWQNLGGTSSAAPKTGAGALLLQDFGVSDAMAVRAILINTADAWTSSNTETTADDGQVSGSHWDKRYGWGYLDLYEAWFNAGDHFTDEVTPRGTDEEFDLFAGWLYQNEKATLVWNRRVGYNDMFYPMTWYDLTDLNMRLYDENGNGVDYEDNDFDVDDNVHQVAASADGFKVIKVYSWSTAIDGADSEPYALAVEEGWSRVDPPDFSGAAISAPDEANCEDRFWVTVDIPNTGGVAGHNVEVTLTLPEGFNIVDGTNPQIVGSVAAGESAVAAWDVYTLYEPGGTGTITATVTSSSYGIPQTVTVTRGIDHPLPPSNDTCGSPIYIVGDFGTDVFSDDSSHACNVFDESEGCTGYASAGREVTYWMNIGFEAVLSVTMTPESGFDPALYVVHDCGDIGGTCVAGSDNIGIGVPEEIVVDIAPGSGDWYYIVCDAYGAGNGGQFTLEVTLSPPAPTETVAVSLDATPSSGLVPFSSTFTASLTNLTDQNRRMAAAITAVLANGRTIPHWRAGAKNLTANEVYTASWTQGFPAAGSVLGNNVFTLTGADVTPAPYNQPPFSPSGDTDTDATTVKAVAP